MIEMVLIYNIAFNNLWPTQRNVMLGLSIAILACCYSAITDMVGYGLTESTDMVGYGLTESNVTSSTPINVTSSTPIKHIVVISQGKRSFDNYFGTFPGANGFKSNTEIPINPFPQITEFTVSVWFNTNNTFAKNGFLINKGGVGIDTPGKNMNYAIWMNAKGNIIAGFETRNGTDYQVNANATFNDGKWHNAIVTYDGSALLSLFVDGASADQVSTAGAVPDAQNILPIRLGANSLKPEDYFKGYIDNVRIWNRTLQSPEIINVYNGTINKNELVLELSSRNDTSANENKISANVTGLKNTKLVGIYLNGSTYKDLEPNLFKQKGYLRPFILNQTKTESPDDSSDGYKMSYNSGRMNGFAAAQVTNKQDPRLVMGYYDDNILSYYWHLASEFVLADNFFAPTMDAGLANHQYLYTATSVDYQKNASFRGKIDINNTIFDELEAGKHSWKVYVQDYDPALNYTNNDLSRNRYLNLLAAIPRFVDNKTLNSHIVDLVNYFKDLEGDKFPAVSFIAAPTSDDSSPKDVTVGQDFVQSLVLALMKSKYWNSSAFIITYRESGGWYDHVAPPSIKDQVYGFRVPTLIISPFAKKGLVDNTVYDVTSILKFIEQNYGLPPLSTRDASANSIIDAFNFSQQPRQPPVFDQGAKNVEASGKILEAISNSIGIVYIIYGAILIAIAVVTMIIFGLPKIRKSRQDT